MVAFTTLISEKEQLHFLGVKARSGVNGDLLEGSAMSSPEKIRKIRKKRRHALGKLEKYQGIPSVYRHTLCITIYTYREQDTIRPTRIMDLIT
jgi:hypothetical protein